MIFSSRSRSILAAYGWGGDLTKIARPFECRVLGANRNPVADPMPAETMCPLSELDRMPTLPDQSCTLRPEARGGDAVPDHRSLRENANNLKRTRNTKAQKSWSSRDCGRDAHYWAPPAV